MNEKKLIFNKLFHTYAIWFVVSMCITLGFALWYYITQINESIIETQKQMTRNITSNIENYFDEMNQFSLELMNSQTFKENAIKKLPEIFENEESPTEIFSKMYIEAYKMIQKKYNVGIITNSGYYICLANNYYIERVNNKHIKTYEEYERNGKPYVRLLESNEYLLDTMKGKRLSYDGEKMLTLSRNMSIVPFISKGQAILEIQVLNSDFEKEIHSLSANEKKNGLTINLLTNKGDIIYQESDLQLANVLKEKRDENKEFLYDGNIVLIHKMPIYNIAAIYTIPVSGYYGKLITFILLAFVFFIIVGGLVIGITYKISRQFSNPMIQICKELGNIELNKGKGYQKVESDIWEIAFLSDSIEELNNKLEDSMNEIITLKDFELHSKLLALQAQMQPHFLFNTLAMINYIAEEESNTKIANICKNLTGMFRYIAAQEKVGVALFEELKHVNHYVNIMQQRFPTGIVDIDIPLEMMSIQIPKLSVQPLVENSFKYCNKANPIIKVHGHIEDGRWEITVSDNGEGFDLDTVKEIYEKCERSMYGVNALSTKIEGMGLVNVYVRLKLVFKESAIFEILPGKDGFIKIGGLENAYYSEKN